MFGDDDMEADERVKAALERVRFCGACGTQLDENGWCPADVRELRRERTYNREDNS